MNYKELIGTLRRFSAYYPITGPIEKEAADAIETLIEERDAALRAKQTAVKLDRSRWEGCDCCKGDLDGYTARFRDAGGRSRPLYIPEGEATIVASGKYNHQFYIPIKYCPFCCRPLTEEAWAELERRLNDGTTD